MSIANHYEPGIAYTDGAIITSQCAAIIDPKEVCVQLPTSADNVTLLAFAAERRPCSNRSISPGRRAHSSKPAAAAFGGFAVVGQTDTRQLDILCEQC